MYLKTAGYNNISFLSFFHILLLPQYKAPPLKREERSLQKYAHDENFDELLMRSFLFYADMIDFSSTFSLLFFSAEYSSFL